MILEQAKEIQFRKILPKVNTGTDLIKKFTLIKYIFNSCPLSYPVCVGHISCKLYKSRRKREFDHYSRSINKIKFSISSQILQLSFYKYHNIKNYNIILIIYNIIYLFSRYLFLFVYQTMNIIRITTLIQFFLL